MANMSGNKIMGFGKILLFVGIAGILISMALIFVGIFYVSADGHTGYFWLSIVGFIGIGISFILIVLGAAGWFLESFANKERGNKYIKDDSQLGQCQISRRNG